MLGKRWVAIPSTLVIITDYCYNGRLMDEGRASGPKPALRHVYYGGMNMYQTKLLFRVVLLLAIAISLPVTHGYAAENLDPSFGEQGVVVTDFGIADDEASAMAVQPDGKILLAGFSSNSVLKDVAVARYLSDGKLDPGFHTTGYVTFNIGEGNAQARAIAVQQDGKIVVVGNYDNGANEASTEIFLVRLTDEGFPDASFGVDGRLLLPLDGQTATAFDLQIAADGDILIAGTAGGTNGPKAMVARIAPQGVLDAGFAESGIATVPREYETAAHSMVLLEDNSILLAGYSKPAEAAGLSLFRLKADGTLDDTFGAQGEVQIAVEGGESLIYDMVAQADGKLVAVGSYNNGSYREVVLGRFLASGAADAEFGNGGLVRNDLGADSVGYGVAMQADGSILATGFRTTDKGKDIILLRYGTQRTEVGTGTDAATESPEANTGLSSADSLDSSQASAAGESSPATEGSDTPAIAAPEPVAVASYVSDSVSEYDDESHALAVLKDGRVLAAGYASNGDDTDFALVQYSSAATDTLAELAAGAGGISSGNFFISTTPVTSVSRNSAMSGGTITERVTDRDCETFCDAQCDTDDTACFDSCLEDCGSPLTVTARGVCFGTARHPVYRAATDETPTDPDTTDDDSILPEASKETSYNYDTVHFGQTSDGTGIGAFGSNIAQITPDTVYYVRAYAVLSDETVIYGNELSFKTSDACFIATAAYGSLLDRHVVQLRNFRDAYLKGNDLGLALVSFYYSVSPGIAEHIRHNEILKQIVRICLWPWVAFSFVMLNLAAAAKIALLLFGILAGGTVLHRFLIKQET